MMPGYGRRASCGCASCRDGGIPGGRRASRGRGFRPCSRPHRRTAAPNGGFGRRLL